MALETKFMKNIYAPLIVALIGWACQSQPGQEDDPYYNPPAEGFNAAESDPAAIELADSIMVAVGGRKNWDATRFISWNFFGARDLVWDKKEGRVRIESNRDSTIYLLNLTTMEGKVQVKGQELTQADSLAKMLDKAKRIWINDSYWLVMPFKLRDPGVTLNYLGHDTTQSGEQAEVIQLQFAGVGVTPDNKYHIWIGHQPKEVLQWAYYRSSQDTLPGFTLSWTNYQRFDPTGIVLSSGRGEREMGDIRVYTELPEDVFNSVTATDW